jgi:hypothetical protein
VFVVQVFLPDKDFVRSVQSLDPTRLGNQIYREAKTLLAGGWKNHPCAKMWSEYKPALAVYCLCGLAELSRRGKDYTKHCDFFKTYLTPQIDMPPWLGNEKLHKSHRRALLLKGILDTTFLRGKILSGYPALKRDWTPQIYRRYWHEYGQPPLNETWYGKLGWLDKPLELNALGKFEYYWVDKFN